MALVLKRTREFLEDDDPSDPYDYGSIKVKRVRPNEVIDLRPQKQKQTKALKEQILKDKRAWERVLKIVYNKKAQERDKNMYEKYKDKLMQALIPLGHTIAPLSQIAVPSIMNTASTSSDSPFSGKMSTILSDLMKKLKPETDKKTSEEGEEVEVGHNPLDDLSDSQTLPTGTSSSNGTSVGVSPFSVDSQTPIKRKVTNLSVDVETANIGNSGAAVTDSPASTSSITSPNPLDAADATTPPTPSDAPPAPAAPVAPPAPVAPQAPQGPIGSSPDPVAALQSTIKGLKSVKKSVPKDAMQLATEEVDAAEKELSELKQKSPDMESESKLNAARSGIENQKKRLEEAKEDIEKQKQEYIKLLNESVEQQIAILNERTDITMERKAEILDEIMANKEKLIAELEKKGKEHINKKLAVLKKNEEKVNQTNFAELERKEHEKKIRSAEKRLDKAQKRRKAMGAESDVDRKKRFIQWKRGYDNTSMVTDPDLENINADEYTKWENEVYIPFIADKKEEEREDKWKQIMGERKVAIKDLQQVIKLASTYGQINNFPTQEIERLTDHITRLNTGQLQKRDIPTAYLITINKFESWIRDLRKQANEQKRTLDDIIGDILKNQEKQNEREQKRGKLQKKLETMRDEMSKNIETNEAFKDVIGSLSQFLSSNISGRGRPLPRRRRRRRKTCKAKKSFSPSSSTLAFLFR